MRILDEFVESIFETYYNQFRYYSSLSQSNKQQVLSNLRIRVNDRINKGYNTIDIVVCDLCQTAVKHAYTIEIPKLIIEIGSLTFRELKQRIDDGKYKDLDLTDLIN